MGRMFKSITRTWNVSVGCDFDCFYCNARKDALNRLKHAPRYRDGFKPHLVEEELKKRFKPGEFIFVSYMGDISFIAPTEVLRILHRIREFPETDFLIQSKNPDYFWEFGFPENVVLGTTLESNKDYGLTKAPFPELRYRMLKSIDHPRKFISIEPIMDFHLETMVGWIREMAPEIVEIGADNYHNGLTEPPWWKVEELLRSLSVLCLRVIEKDGLRRLNKQY